MTARLLSLRVAILLTAFLAVFGPATQGIRRAISVQEADRLVLERLVPGRVVAHDRFRAVVAA